MITNMREKLKDMDLADAINSILVNINNTLDKIHQENQKFFHEFDIRERVYRERVEREKRLYVDKKGSSYI